MKKPITPENESSRLAALAEYEILDTDAEDGFDAVTTLAAHILQVPIALVSIVDEDRQWFKSRYGLEAPETPRDVSFCGHVVGDDKGLVVPDAFEDERFSDNPLVTGDPRVRFYAGVPLRMSSGHVLGTLCAIDHKPRKITQAQEEQLRLLATQVVAQLELRRSKRLLAAERSALAVHRRFFELSFGLLATARDGTFELLNPSWENALGWSLEELRAKPFLDFVHPDDIDNTIAEASKLTRDDAYRTFNFENRYRHKDGSWVPLAWAAAQSGGLLYAAATDMTVFYNQESELKERESRLQALLDGMAEGVVIQDDAGAITKCNPAAERALGLSFDQMIGRNSVDPRWRSVHPDGRAFPGEEHPSMITLRTGEAQRDVVMGVHKPSGELTWLSVNSVPLLHNGDEKPYAVAATFHDITGRVQTDGQLAEQRRMMTSVLKTLPNSVVALFDTNLRIVEIYGTPLGEARPGDSLSSWAGTAGADDLLNAARDCLRGVRTSTELTYDQRRHELTFVPLQDRSGLIETGLVLAYDVSEREALRAQIARQDRLVTTGTLASGVGHEINNPLSFILTNLDYALLELRGMGGGSPSSRITDLVEALDDARQGAERIRKIVRGLRVFAREGGAVGPTDVHAAIELSRQMAMHDLRHSATCELELGDIPRVLADESRLSQVLVNLLVNAAQAFTTSDPGLNRILVRTRRALDDRVQISVVDNGPGIPAELRERVFDPFFTTKPVGTGTGLGLAICHSIVSELGGELRCEETPGGGTTFQIFLPGIEEREEEEAEPTRAKATRVMIVDDEPAVLRALTRLLQREHEVVAFDDPRSARHALLSEGTYDVVFCDLMMPHLTGPQLFAEVCETRPELRSRFVFITGGVNKEEIRRFLEETSNERIEKPFSAQHIRGVARRYAGLEPD